MQFLNPSPLPFYQTSQAVSIQQNPAANRDVRDPQRELIALPSEKTGLNAKFSHGNFKVDIPAEEKTGKLRKFTEVVFLRRNSVSCRHAAAWQVAFRKKPENPHEKQNPGSIDLQCPGESKWRDSIPFAQWSPETLGAGFVLPFALTNSGRFRLRRTAHWADTSLVCRGRRGFFPHHSG